MSEAVLEPAPLICQSDIEPISQPGAPPRDELPLHGRKENNRLVVAIICASSVTAERGMKRPLILFKFTNNSAIQALL